MERSNSGNLILSEKDGIATIEFSHPKANCLPLSLLRKLAQSLRDCEANPDVRVIVLKSSGEKTFCAGASFEDLQLVKSEIGAREFFSGFAEVLCAIQTLTKFLICRVQGKAVGGGVGLIAASDYVFAVSSASVRLSEFEHGIGPFTIAPAIERKIGIGKLLEASIDTEWRDANWCLANGLYSQITEDLALLEVRVDSFARVLADRDVEATKQLRQAFWLGTQSWGVLLSERAAVSGKLWIEKQAKAGH